MELRLIMCQESVHLWAAKGVRIFCHLSPLAKFAHIKQQYSLVYVPGLSTPSPDYIVMVSYVA
ncbi:hypothetical protein ACS72_00615 [Acinetobacter sp. VT 511]|nr:hypothetical protein ACS72_00615 [Acinetobacter sp. VT 511]